MCRIAGIVSPQLPIESIQDAVAAMCHAQRHGGPDGEGFYASTGHHLVLGHRRLAIIDLADSGLQPMQYADRYTISYNGEIYNYRELKTELAALGFPFHSTGDTEVILAAFAAWGTDGFAHLEGMFAFALFDQYTGDLYLVRDLLGIKPLYYSLQQESLVFASEVRAFSRLPQPPEEDPFWPVYFLAYGHLPEPVTTLKGVKPLRKGCYLQYNTGTGQAKTESFDRLVYLEGPAPRETILERIRSGLKASVGRHLRADATLGVFLSGGIDSSLLALLAGAEKGEDLKTISVQLSEKAFSEKPYQDLVRDRLSSDHQAYHLTADEFHYSLPDMVGAMDLPSSDGLNTWLLAKKAAAGGLKAVLSGLGGDELFGGYPSFRRMGLATALQTLPVTALRAARYSYGKKGRRIAYLGLEGARGQYLFLRGILTPPAIAAFLDTAEEEVWDLLESSPVLPDTAHLSNGNKASWLELNLYMQNQLLRDADVMSMAHGLEIRVPFLDKNFVKEAIAFPSNEKYGGPFGKDLLIEAFRDILPEPVWKRKKMGFSFPFAAWLKEDEWIRSEMMGGGRPARKAIHQFDRGELHWSALLAFFLVQQKTHATIPAFFNA